MPQYCFKCHCGETVTLLLAMSRRNDKVRCNSCNRPMSRDLRAEQLPSYGQDYAHELLSDAMGVHPDQVAEHRRDHPDVPITDDGRVICKNAVERKKHMRTLGMYDRDSYY